ncbi:hypothetical protein Goarm_002381, partial [Gossypium armourianum]|nr:hypothetical protein [Gossypium armourianum]
MPYANPRIQECISIEFWPIATFSMSKCHWLFLQRSRCSNSIKSRDSSSVCNVFCRHPKSLMTYTRSTCGEDSRKIDQHSTKSISRCGSVGTISFQPSKRSRQHCRRRPKRGRINPRSEDGDKAGLTFAPFALEDLIAVQPPGQC